MKTRMFLPFVCGAVAAAFVTSTSAQTILWSENFETDTTANWNVNTLGGGSDANVLNDRGLPTVNLSAGYEQVHTANEFMPLERLEQAYRLVLALVEVAGAAGRP